MVIYNEKDIRQIVFEIKNGKALICPTDTVNGLISKNLDLIFKLKRRSPNKKIILFIPNLSYVKKPNLDFIKLAKKYWPGPLTLIYNNVSYRIPNSIFINKLLELSGPLYCSSANKSGEPTPSNTIDAYAKFNDRNKIIIIDGVSSSKIASTIYNINTKTIVREGNIKLKDIQLCLK